MAHARLAGRGLLPGEVLSGTGAGRLRAAAPADQGGQDAPRFPVQGAGRGRTAPDLRRPLCAGALLRPDLLPFVPDLAGLRFQALHTDDAARAFRAAVVGDVRGPFNLAAEPVIDARELADLLEARVVRVPRALVRTALAAAWHSHAVPASPHLFDAVLRLPVLDCARARDLLDWRPNWTAREALSSFLSGVRRDAGLDTPPLAGGRWG